MPKATVWFYIFGSLFCYVAALLFGFEPWKCPVYAAVYVVARVAWTAATGKEQA